MKVVKFLFPILLTILASSCVVINESRRDLKKTESKYFSYICIDKDFSDSQKAAIIWAVSYFQEKVPCVTLEISATLPPEQIRGISISILKDSDRKNGREIGFYLTQDEKEFILVWPYDEQDKIVKIALHELSHAFGMPMGHAYPEILQDRSVLSPIIGNRSLPILYDKDQSYLTNLICGEKRE